MTDGRKRALKSFSAVLVGGVFLLMVAVLGVFPVLDSWQATADSIDRSERLLEGYRRISAEAPATNTQFDALRDQDTKFAGLAGGATSALAVASLQADVKQIVESHGGTIQSMQPGGVTKVHGIERLDVKVDLSVPGAMFEEFVKALDSHRPGLAIDPWELHVPAGGPQQDRLTIRMTVSAYRRPASS